MAANLELRTLGMVDLRAADGRVLQSVLAQPKRLALLVYLTLAQASGGFFRRDRLVALFWPELDEEHARAALRNTVYNLRRTLGHEAIGRRGDEEIGIAAGYLTCDATVFEASVSSGDPAAALALYRGDLLPGFYIPDAPAFDEWLEQRRTQLRRTAADAAWRHAEVAGLPPDELVARAHRAAELSGVNESTLRRLLLAFERAGDRAGAAHAFDDFRRRLHAEFDLEPSAELFCLRDRIREGGRVATVAPGPPPAAVAAVAAVAPGPPPAVAAYEVRPARRSRRWQAITTALVVLIPAAAALFAARGTPESTVFAVTTMRDLTGDSTAQYAQVLPELLATSLARAPGAQVISMARLYALISPTEATDGSAQLASAARRAGATAYIEGALYRVPGDSLRLDVRWVSTRDGAVLRAHSVTGADVFTVVENASALLLPPALAGAAPRIADVTTTSLPAFQLYQRGLRALYQQDNRAAAHAFFEAALEEDTTFAMAAYYAFQSSGDRNDLLHARAHARRTTDRERLLILATWASWDNDPATLALADTLATRYPAEPEGHLLLGRAHSMASDFLTAIRHLQRAVAMDSAGLSGATLYCRACEALEELTLAYLHADSQPAALRTAERLQRERPQLSVVYHLLAHVHEAGGSYAEAERSRERQAELTGLMSYAEVYPAVLALHQAEFATADDLLQARMRSTDASARHEALWYRVIALRYQGRLREALQADTLFKVNQAIVLFEIGRPRDAAILFEELARPVEPPGEAWFARNRIWNLTHAAAAYAAAGDTARLLPIAEEMQTLARHSAYGRDHRLHHHVRGLWHAARGEHVAAVDAFHQAIFSMPAGYTRTNLELARSLVALGRSRDAIPPLQAAFRNSSLSSVTLYATRTELHEALGLAFDLAGQRDSAAVHYQWVLKAWQHADPQFHLRRERIRQRLPNG